MRLLASVLGAMLSCTHAWAAQPVLMDDYAAASESFMGGITDDRQWLETYRTRILSGIDGNWIPLSLARPGTADDIRKICTVTFNRIAATSPYAFTMNRHFSKDVALDFSYTYVVGNTFAEHVDADKLLGAFGVNSPQVASARLGILSSANGHIAVFRPREDILVLQYPRRAPIIYGRCPR